MGAWAFQLKKLTLAESVAGWNVCKKMRRSSDISHVHVSRSKGQSVRGCVFKSGCFVHQRQETISRRKRSDVACEVLVGFATTSNRHPNTMHARSTRQL